ncbi:glutamate-rich protein 2 [Nerophis ophidion]|uniref:glutamate-rich protein 2 n=1 Tax=Nerophis ophidion TaxID=159077 RepID=UPI002ADF8F20|nr:glutamate-rich protein 2 [Nerophis ophidion]XP_061747425.1 glutamate-rich protein 2 [Nerophis ophidion]
MQTGNENQTEDDLQVPLGLKIEFLRALKAKDLQRARSLCQMILLYEPHHPEASEFLPLIQKKLLQEQEEADQGSGDSDQDDVDSGSDGESAESSSSSQTSDEEQEKIN